jgi:hypothetical protein
LLILWLLNYRLNFIGDLLAKARELTGETYHFKKGYSRAKMNSDSEGNNMEPKEKRKKIMKAERWNEIENLSKIIKSNNDQVAIKRKRLEKAKSINDFALCDPKLFWWKKPITSDKSLHSREKKPSQKAIF